MKSIVFLLGLIFLVPGSPLHGQTLGTGEEWTQITEDLEVRELVPGVLIHRSWEMDTTWGRFSSNGLIFVHSEDQCIIFDTPIQVDATLSLLDWLKGKAEVEMLVVNHFHRDCTAGLELFRSHGIPTIGNRRTSELLMEKGKPVPDLVFTKRKRIGGGENRVELWYPGPGHSPDNTVAWIPAKRVLFGGCLIKCAKCGKGNLKDADVDEWAASVARVEKRYPATHVVPGHGKAGGRELLKHTCSLFSRD